MVSAELKAFRAYIDHVMAETGWATPTEVAKKSGLAASTVNRPYAKDDIDYAPGLRTINTIARASGIQPPPELVGAGVANGKSGSNDMDHASRTLLKALLDLYDPWTIIREMDGLAAEKKVPPNPQRRA